MMRNIKFLYKHHQARPINISKGKVLDNVVKKQKQTKQTHIKQIKSKIINEYEIFQ